MRVGVERWVGLRLSPASKESAYDSELYACTSGGFFRHVNLGACTEKVDANKVAESTTVWTIPSPLHHVAFYPDDTSVRPTHFASGGEQVLLSIWHVDQVIENARAAPASTQEGGDASVEHAGKKRNALKSSKARELLPGEVWRAKNLPNDHLSLARPPMIRYIAFLPRKSECEDAAVPKVLVVVGTKDGKLRVYDPSAKVKHTHEWQVVPKNQGSIRVLHATPSEDGAIFVGDTSRHLHMVDSRTGRTLFQYKDITGTVSDLTTFVDTPRKRTLLLGASLDHLVRLFDTGAPYGTSHRQRGRTLEQYFTGTDQPIAMALDPHTAVPEAVPEDDDKVWANMAVVGKDASDDSDAEEVSAKRSEKRHRS